MAEKRYTEAEWRAIDDLRKNWGAFCDCDPFDGAVDFADRMEKAGLIQLRRVTCDDLEQSFASERGIERGGSVWDLTKKGHSLLVATHGGQSGATE